MDSFLAHPILTVLRQLDRIGKCHQCLAAVMFGVPVIVLLGGWLQWRWLIRAAIFTGAPLEFAVLFLVIFNPTISRALQTLSNSSSSDCRRSP